MWGGFGGGVYETDIIRSRFPPAEDDGIPVVRTPVFYLGKTIGVKNITRFNRKSRDAFVSPLKSHRSCMDGPDFLSFYPRIF